MAERTNEAVSELIALYFDAKDILKRVENVCLHHECPSDVKHRVLNPFKPKLNWFKSALESKISDHMSASQYKDSYNTNIALNKANRMLSRMNPNQQEFALKMITGILEGQVLNVELIEPDDEIY